MNMGRRIADRLSALGWKQRDLLDKVPDLTPQGLSNLIARDSKRSEFDLAIAEALGESVLWLVYGIGDERSLEGLAGNGKHTLLVRPMPPDPPSISEAVRLMRATDATGRAMALGAIKGALAGYRPSPKANAAQ